MPSHTTAPPIRSGLPRFAPSPREMEMHLQEQMQKELQIEDLLRAKNYVYKRNMKVAGCVASFATTVGCIAGIASNIHGKTNKQNMLVLTYFIGMASSFSVMFLFMLALYQGRISERKRQNEIQTALALEGVREENHFNRRDAIQVYQEPEMFFYLPPPARDSIPVRQNQTQNTLQQHAALNVLESFGACASSISLPLYTEVHGENEYRIEMIGNQYVYVV